MTILLLVEISPGLHTARQILRHLGAFPVQLGQRSHGSASPGCPPGNYSQISYTWRGGQGSSVRRAVMGLYSSTPVGVVSMEYAHRSSLARRHRNRLLR